MDGPKRRGANLVLAGVEVDAWSVAGLETCIHLPRHGLAFDLGHCPERVIARDTILFTHAHVDHMGAVVWHAATRALQGMAPPLYLVPRENADDFRALFEAWRRLDRSELPHRMVPIGPGEDHELSPRLVARPFRSPHRAPCQGYALWRRKKRLRPEHAGRSQEEIRRLRVQEGVEVDELVETPEVAFTGDTTIDVVEREEVVRAARLLILECTFVDDRVSVESCREHGHVHLHDIAAVAELFRNEAILLTHFSRRYRADEIEAALDRELPAELRARVTPLLDGHR